MGNFAVNAPTRHFGGRRNLLTEEEQAKVIRLYIADLLTQAVLARRFGVSIGTIQSVLAKHHASKPNRTLHVK